MLYVSILTSDRNLDPELWALVWNQRKPSDLKLHNAYNLAGNKRLFVWESNSVEGLQFMDVFNLIGELMTYPAFDRTNGWTAAFNGDLDAFKQANRTTLTLAGVKEEEIEKRVARQVELRKGALEAENIYEAQAVARRWKSDQSGQCEA